MLLEGRTAFVTGGAGRIGRAIAETFMREGAAVVLADRDRPRLVETRNSLAAGLRRTVRIVAGDVADPEAVAAMVEDAVGSAGLPDILVNAHGIFPNFPVLEASVEAWDEIFAVNVRGSMLTAQALARRWVAEGVRGAIVNISSGAARSARAGGAAYAGSKAAVNMLTHVLAIELGPHGIRVNAVAPGLILDQVVTPETPDQHPYVTLSAQATPLGRTGRPEEVAEAVAFLASDRSPWTTGAILEVTGGSHCGRTQMPTTGNLR